LGEALTLSEASNAVSSLHPAALIWRTRPRYGVPVGHPAVLRDAGGFEHVVDVSGSVGPFDDECEVGCGVTRYGAVVVGTVSDHQGDEANANT
jgi:hypothetical protein